MRFCFLLTNWTGSWSLLFSSYLATMLQANLLISSHYFDLESLKTKVALIHWVALSPEALQSENERQYKLHRNPNSSCLEIFFMPVVWATQKVYQYSQWHHRKHSNCKLGNSVRMPLPAPHQFWRCSESDILRGSFYDSDTGFLIWSNQYPLFLFCFHSNSSYWIPNR